MVEGEATQEPTAPEGASASPPAEMSSEPESRRERGRRRRRASAAAATWSGRRRERRRGRDGERRGCGGERAGGPGGGLVAPARLPGARAARRGACGAGRLRGRTRQGVRGAGRALRPFGRRIDRVVERRLAALDGRSRGAGGRRRIRCWQPRAVLLADDALAGEDRAAVENRVGLWLAAHIRKVLGSLLALAEGAELPDAARALGAKIAEALGVLERDRVRAEVKGLDQTARGALRKLGVRFGSLYIYAPLLLKPGGARSLLACVDAAARHGGRRRSAAGVRGRGPHVVRQ